MTIVFTEGDEYTVDELMAKYDERLAVPPYIKKTKQQLIDERRKDLELVREMINDGVDNVCEKYKDEYTEEWLRHMYKENKDLVDAPDDKVFRSIKKELKDMFEAKFDKDGNLLSTYNPEARYDYYQIQFVENLSELKELFDHDGGPCCFVDTEGNWHELGRVGWFASIENPKDDEVWDKEVNDYIESQLSNKNVKAFVLDCHI